MVRGMTTNRFIVHLRYSLWSLSNVICCFYISMVKLVRYLQYSLQDVGKNVCRFSRVANLVYYVEIK